MAEENPKDVIGSKKVSMAAVPCPVLAELALAMQEGSRKYGRHNYRVAGVRAEVYYDACMRHIMVWWEGEDIDPDSGLSHLSKAMACLVILKDSMNQGNWIDDRPPKSQAGWVPELNQKASDIIDKYPNGTQPFTENRKELLL